MCIISPLSVHEGQLPTEILKHEICKKEKKFVNKNKANYGPMLPETKQLLQDFFRDKNRELSDLLNNERFLWKEE